MLRRGCRTGTSAEDWVLNKHLLLSLSLSSKRTRMERVVSLVIKRSLMLLRRRELET
jgi:hypothetical protein